ncbi:MAG: hypothetical protein FGF53_04760 [Candidatus Brockarchaeota archaeon]|nr:hypothetical protein [Candidatus Brockarchaeota archaeon]
MALENSQWSDSTVLGPANTFKGWGRKVTSVLSIGLTGEAWAAMGISARWKHS